MIELVGDFAPEERAFLVNETSMLYVIKTQNSNVYGVMDFLFTHALVNGVEMHRYGNAYKDRYCYPKDAFSLDTMVEMCRQWDGESVPPDGWLKYKGVAGEYSPDQADELQKRRAAVGACSD